MCRSSFVRAMNCFVLVSRNRKEQEKLQFLKEDETIVQWYFYNYRIITESCTNCFCFSEIWCSPLVSEMKQKIKDVAKKKKMFPLKIPLDSISTQLFSSSLNFCSRTYFSSWKARVKYYLANCPNKLNFPSF